SLWRKTTPSVWGWQVKRCRLKPGAKTRVNPWGPVEINFASVFGTRVAEPILASDQTPRKQAGHMIASDPIKTLYLNLQAGGRPHMGPGSPPDHPGSRASGYPVPGSARMTIDFDSVRTPNALSFRQWFEEQSHGHPTHQD